MNLLTLWSQLAFKLHAFNMFWTIGIHGSLSCGWSINALTTFYNSTCLTILALMWKGTKDQSMIACLSTSQNAQTLESNMTISKSTNSWPRVLVMYLVWSNFGFSWCECDCGTSSNTFTYAFAYLDNHK
jgi:hypothetical protein